MTLLGTLTIDKTDLTGAQFNCFLNEPFQPVGMTQRRDRYMHAIGWCRLAVFGDDFKGALALIGRRDTRLEAGAFSVCDVNDIASATAQCTNGMPGFVRVKVMGAV